MGRRHRRRRSRRGRAKRYVFAAAAVAGLGVFAVSVLPWAYSEFGGVIEQFVGDMAEETMNMVSRQGADFPELTVTVEEVSGGFYYEQLTEEEQTVYREMLQGVEEMQETVSLHAGRDDHPEKVYEYLMYDRPELFYCDGSSTMTVYEKYTEFSPGYTCGPKEKAHRQAEIDEAAEDCLSGISEDASDYDKIRYIYEYIVNEVDYDETASDNQNIYSALVGKRSVCAGYSRAAQYLLEKLDIECIYVVGTAQGQSAHAWNIVNCEGRYYQMDATFGDPVFLAEEGGENLPGDIIYYDYLCCTDEEILADHEPNGDVVYPACDSDDLNYYKMNGMYYEHFDPQILLGDMNDSIYAGEEMFICKFSGDETYEEAREAMVGDLFPKAAQTLASAYGLDTVKYTYVEDEVHHKVTVFWNYE